MDAGDVGATKKIMRIIAGDFEFEVRIHTGWNIDKDPDGTWKLDVVVRKVLIELCKMFKEVDRVVVKVAVV